MKYDLIRPCGTLLVLLMAACGGSDGSNVDGGSADAAAVGDASTAVTGQSQLTFATETGTRAVSIDLSLVEVEALVPNGASFDVIAGAGFDDGSFVITGVPFVRYYLRLGTNYYLTSERSHEISFAKIGRDDADTLTDPTLLQVNASGLDDWSTGDTLQLYSPGAGTAAFGLEQLSEPNIGATTADIAVDLSGFAGNAIDASKGDELFLTQLASRVDGNNAPYRALSRMLRATDLSIASGQGASFAGLMDPIVSATTVAVEWSNLSVIEFIGQMVPSQSSIVSERVRVLASPVDPRSGAIAPLPLLADAPLAGAASSLVELAFDNPFSSSWTVIEETRVDVEGTLQTLGGSDVTIKASLVSAGPAGSLSGRVSTPTLGPVVSIQVDGSDSSQRITSVSQSPIVEWQAPMIGMSSGYVVELFKTQDPGGTSTRVASFYTTEPKVTIPLGLVDDQSEYWLKIEAWTLSGRNFATDPHRRTIPYAMSAAVTNLFSR